MEYNSRTRTVLYRSSRSHRTKRNFEIYSGTEFLAALAQHIPPPSFQTIRYYGVYSNRRRRHRPSTTTLTEIDHRGGRGRHGHRRRRSWRNLILATWGSDPLRCPCCRGRMHASAPVEKPSEIRNVLEPLGLWSPVVPETVHVARAPPSTVRWLFDADTGIPVRIDRERNRRFMQIPRPFAWPAERFRPPEDSEDPPTFASEAETPIDLGDGLILIPDPDGSAPPDDEPVFWTD